MAAERQQDAEGDTAQKKSVEQGGGIADTLGQQGAPLMN